MMIVTRTLTPEEYGTWTLISSLIVFGIVITPVISFWNTREIARGIESAKTAVVSSIILSLVGITTYLIIAFLVGQQSEIKLEVLFFGVIWIPTIFVNKVLTSIDLGWKTHTVNYSIIGAEVTKIVLAFILLYYLQIGVYGVIIAYTFATVISIFILIFFTREKLKHSFQFSFFTKWTKLSWLPIYTLGLTLLLAKLDIIIFMIITNSIEGLALFGAASVVGGIVSVGGSISSGLYPKLLGGIKEQVSENIRLLFFFSIPLLATVIIFSKAGLFALNPIYEIVFPITILISFRVFFSTLTGSFAQILRGNEKVDVNEYSSFRDYIKSKLFYIPTLRLIQFSIYLITLLVVFVLGKEIYSMFELLVLWSIISVIVQIPLTFHLFFIVRKELNLKLDPVILKYLIVSIGIFSLTYYLMDEYLVFEENLFEFIPNLLIYLIFGVVSYLVIISAIDKKTRNLIKVVLKEINK